MGQTDEKTSTTSNEPETLVGGTKAGTEPGTNDEQAQLSKKLKAPATRKQLTGVELEARFDDWFEGRRAKRAERTPEDVARSMRRGVAVVMGVGMLVLVMVYGAMNSSFAHQASVDTGRIGDLQVQVDQAKSVPQDTGAAGLLTEVATAAARDGKAVATAQQEFAGLNHRISVEPDPGNGAPNQAAVDMAEHRRALAPYFDPGSYIAKDKDAYIWQNVPPFDEATEIDPRFAWYVRYDGETASPAGASSWTVEMVTPVLDGKSQTAATNSATVVWLCRDTATGKVLAWARATYVYDAKAKKGTFKDLDLVITSFGASHQQSSKVRSEAEKVPDLKQGGQDGKNEGKGQGR